MKHVIVDVLSDEDERKSLITESTAAASYEWDEVDEETLCEVPPSKLNDLTVKTKKIVQTIKITYSTGLLFFCIYFILSGIFANQTPISQVMSPLLAFAIMWISILWLGLLEGGQGCLVGLQPIDKSKYATSHPVTFQCAALAHKADNLNRFIIGRQFFVVLMVFVLNLCCTVVAEAKVPGVPLWVVQVFLQSGLAVMLITVMLGQLSAEVNATNCMLDFVNTPLMYWTTHLCLAIEWSGLLHSVYLVQHFFAMFVPEDKDDQKDEESATLTGKVWYWIRVLISFGMVAYAMVVTLTALVESETTMYDGLSNIVTIFIFFGLICFLGILEAIQIALFAVVNLPQSQLSKRAAANCKLAFRGNNFQALLIGRQICVTMSMFFLARITTTNVPLPPPPPPIGVLGPDALLPPPPPDTVLHISRGLQGFFNTGLPGALITTVVASLAWRILAATFPMAFMGNILVYFTIRLCLFLEALGVFSASWLLADMLKRVLGLQLDTDYLGSMGQRQAHGNPNPHHHNLFAEEELLEDAYLSHQEYGATTDAPRMKLSGQDTE
jgi:hypothetical protein